MWGLPQDHVLHFLLGWSDRILPSVCVSQILNLWLVCLNPRALQNSSLFSLEIVMDFLIFVSFWHVWIRFFATLWPYVEIICVGFTGTVTSPTAPPWSTFVCKLPFIVLVLCYAPCLCNMSKHEYDMLYCILCMSFTCIVAIFTAATWAHILDITTRVKGCSSDGRSWIAQDVAAAFGSETSSAMTLCSLSSDAILVGHATARSWLWDWHIMMWTEKTRRACFQYIHIYI